VKLAEVFVADYHDLHKEELEYIRQQPTVDKEKLKSYYQSDRKLCNEQERERIEAAVRNRGV
jgi:esterase/lipase